MESCISGAKIKYISMKILVVYINAILVMRVYLFLNSGTRKYWKKKEGYSQCHLER